MGIQGDESSFFAWNLKVCPRLICLKIKNLSQTGPKHTTKIIINTICDNTNFKLPINVICISIIFVMINNLLFISSFLIWRIELQIIRFPNSLLGWMNTRIDIKSMLEKLTCAFEFTNSRILFLKVRLMLLLIFFQRNA